jgi:hypothetical protein
MVARTWIGGGNNEADNPKDWSPTGVPHSGDTLSMASGTMNIMGHDLASDGLAIIGPAKINMDNATVASIYNPGGVSGVNLTVNMYGTNHVAFDMPYSQTTINIHGKWIGSLNDSVGLAYATVNGGTFENVSSTIGHDGGGAVINSDVVGVGTFLVSAYHGGLATLEFMRSVGAGQSVIIGSSFQWLTAVSY